MKILPARTLTALLALSLTACSSAATESAPRPSTSATASSSPSATASPTQVGSSELREAIDTAMLGHSNGDALDDMEALHSIALTEVRPAVSVEDWGMADIVRTNASLGALKGTLTDEELGLEGIKYATLIAGIASNAGVFSW